MAEILRALSEAPLIAAVRGREQLLRATETAVKVVFLLDGDPFTLPEMVEIAHRRDKLVFIHLDLVAGISKDAAGVHWIAKSIGPTGVLSTRGPLLRAAADEGLSTILRIFLVDSSSLHTGVKMAKSAAPTLVEVMPGLVTRAIGQLGARIAQPIIAGGMLEREEDVQQALKAGALAASTSSEALWSKPFR